MTGMSWLELGLVLAEGAVVAYLWWWLLTRKEQS